MNPNRIYLNIGSFSKLEHIFFCPFEVLYRVVPVAYRISLSTNMRSHNILHVSLLMKYVHGPNHIMDWNVIQVEPKGEFQVEPTCILNRK